MKKNALNVLAIGAHFDDIELGCGGTLAKHIKNGDKVIGLIVTHSKYTDYNGKLMRARETALREGKKAARIIGYEMLCLNRETKQVKFEFDLIEEINRIIDSNKIDLIYTHWDSDVHQDHQAIGRATMNAGRKIQRIFMYQSNLYMNTKLFNANYFVDISKFIEIKMKAIRAHEAEIKKFGEDWLQFWFNETKNNGQRVGVAHAEAFQLVRYLA